MTRLQRVLCVALGLLATAAVLAATVVHARAEAGRVALAEADRAHLDWYDARVQEVAAQARLRDIAAQEAALRLATARSDRRLLRAIERARHARRRVVHAKPRVVYRVHTVLISAVAAR
jgi:membrane-bound lytic murein transglycosylase B